MIRTPHFKDMAYARPPRRFVPRAAFGLAAALFKD